MLGGEEWEISSGALCWLRVTTKRDLQAGSEGRGWGVLGCGTRTLSTALLAYSSLWTVYALLSFFNRWNLDVFRVVVLKLRE